MRWLRLPRWHVAHVPARPGRHEHMAAQPGRHSAIARPSDTQWMYRCRKRTAPLCTAVLVRSVIVHPRSTPATGHTAARLA